MTTARDCNQASLVGEREQIASSIAFCAPVSVVKVYPRYPPIILSDYQK